MFLLRGGIEKGKGKAVQGGGASSCQKNLPEGGKAGGGKATGGGDLK